MKRQLSLTAIAALFAGAAQSAAPAAPDLAGTYESTPSIGSLKGVGDPSTVKGSTKGFSEDSPEITVDPAKLCQPVGPFRMMAMAPLKFELAPTKGAILMLFEDISHGYRRTIHLDRGHKPDLQPTWQGDSVGRWEGATLVVDTVGFSEYTWLNGAGVRNSTALHLVERIRQLPGGGLEYRVVATDPKSLTAPASYIRYFKKTDVEIVEDTCDIELG